MRTAGEPNATRGHRQVGVTALCFNRRWRTEKSSSHPALTYFTLKSHSNNQPTA